METLYNHMDVTTTEAATALILNNGFVCRPYQTHNRKMKPKNRIILFQCRVTVM